VRTSVDVHNFLIEREIPHELFPARGRLRSPELLAAALDLPPGEVGKVVVFEGPDGPVAAVVPSGHHPDPKRVRRVSGQPEIEPVTEDRASELTGYLPEAVPPAGLPDTFTVILDRALNRDGVLYFAGGEVRSVLKIRGKDLVKATNARVASIAAPSDQ
jgi:prolyl-tRNA editing enzyme YbaK/EbsC (Cys-tRNA(Pro) deacylase)